MSSRDSGGNEVVLRDVVVPSAPIPITLEVDAALAEVELEIIEVTPTGADRVLVHRLELFGTP